MNSMNMTVGWLGFGAGAVSGALIGLRFHAEEWMGGYGAFRRRLLRLGHIACFGVGFLNVLFALSAVHPGAGAAVHWGGLALAWAQVAMPLVCFLTAWRAEFRHLFSIPVLLIGTGICGMVLNQFAS